MEKQAGRDMAPNFLSSTFSTTVRRVLLWGVPSLTLLGLVGMVSWRWLRRKPSANVNSLPPAPAASYTCDPTNSPDTSKHLPASERSPSSEDSGVVDTGCSSGKNSEGEDPPASTFRIPSGRGSQLRRSSNLPLEAEAPLKPPTIPSIQNEESYSEMDSTSSSEGLLSLPAKSPIQHDSAAILALKKTAPEASNTMKEPRPGSSLSSTSPAPSNKDVQCQPKPDGDQTEPDGDQTDPSTEKKSKDTVVAKKDRVRIMVHIPRGVVGRFIGKQGRNIKALMTDSNGAHVYVNQKNVPKDAQSVLCTIQGTSEQVEEAIKIIEAKYPEIDTPAISLLGLSSFQQHISPVLGTPSTTGDDPWGVELLSAVIPSKPFSATASFIEGVTDVWLVAWEKCMEVDRMHSNMSYMYKRLYPDGPDTPSEVAEESEVDLLGKFCAVRVSHLHWLRGRVTRVGDCLDSYEVQLVDYGSMVLVPSSSVKPLRKEYSLLPVQAFKSKVAHVQCKDTDLVQEGMICLQQMLDGQMMEAHITSILSFSEEAASSLKGDSGCVKSEVPSSCEKDSPSDGNAKNDASPLFFPSALPSSDKADAPCFAAASNSPEAATCPTVSASSPEIVATPTITTVSSPSSPRDPSLKKFSPLAPYIPVVELYIQRGAQTPTFVNRELVELGYAAWKEETVQKSFLMQKSDSYNIIAP